MSSNVYTKRVKITPDIAAEMLENNTMNRNVSMTHVKNLAHAMGCGNWAENGETITIAEDGTLLDGQHRLWAVIESGLPIVFQVAYNVKKSVMPTIGQGITRHFYHVLKIKGSPRWRTAAAITKLAWIYDYFDSELNSASCRNSIQNTVLDNYYDQNEALIEHIAEVVASRKHHFVTSHMGLAYLLFMRTHPRKAEEFITMLKTGENLHAKHPIMALRMKLISNLMNKQKLSVRETLAYYIKAWNAYIKGKELSIFRWNNTLPLPEAK
jgi:hypothetical protein